MLKVYADNYLSLYEFRHCNESLKTVNDFDVLIFSMVFPQIHTKIFIMSTQMLSLYTEPFSC